MSCVIYGLCDPRTGALRYVGKTTGSLNTRLRGHLGDVHRGRVYIPRHRWIKELLAASVEPEICLIEVVKSDWREAEQHWIELLRAQGCDLLNATGGGDGLHRYSHRAETRAKQSAAAIARYRKPGERERSGAAVSAAFKRPEARENLRAARARLPAETKRAAALRLVEWSKSQEGRAVKSAMAKGRPKSAETRAKLSAAATGRVWTEEQRRAASNSRKGRRHSVETRAKIAASARLRRSS